MASRTSKQSTGNTMTNQTPEQKKQAFLIELKALLAKYNASIEASCEGDTHGIYEETISVVLYKPNSFRQEAEFTVQGWCIDEDSIES